jgi:hypothetical protein
MGAVVVTAGLGVPLAMLARLGAEPDPAPGRSPGARLEGTVTHLDAVDGLAVTLPESWDFEEEPTQPIEPENVLAARSWAFPRGGVCAPFAALRELPPDGAFLWLIEYHGPQQLDDFVPRPERFEAG